MKKISLIFASALVLTAFVTSCKKSQPSYMAEGTFKGHFEGTYAGNDTIINENYTVTVVAIDKSTITVSGSLFASFDVIVAKNGINVEQVSPTEGLNQFLYVGESEELSFTFESGGNNAVYIGTKM